jgi:hypothetical protein
LKYAAGEPIPETYEEELELGSVTTVANPPPGLETGEPHITPSAVLAQLHTPPDIAREQDILGKFATQVRVCGVVGEEKNAKRIYLGLTSRHLDEPVSLAVKGLTSSGKSYVIDVTLDFFPDDAYIELTAMSERALIYDKRDFQHKTLVLFEAVALREQREKTESNLTAYFVRSLLSEGRIRYPVTIKNKEGQFVTQVIEKNGPTNMILSTTATSLHGENETRMLSLPTNDSSEQTGLVLRQTALKRYGDHIAPDLGEWVRFQEWITQANHKVVVPFAEDLSKVVPPVAVRLRRDWNAILGLIESHAILHQLSREQDSRGRIIATETDYIAVRDLVIDLISEGVGATVSESMRETVERVSDLCPRDDNGDPVDGITVTALAGDLDLDRSAVQRRLTAAREKGYVVNLEDRRGRPARYVPGDRLPDEVLLLPTALPHTRTDACDPETPGQEGVCTCARPAEGVMYEGPPPEGDGSPAGIEGNGSQLEGPGRDGCLECFSLWAFGHAEGCSRSVLKKGVR